MAEAVKKLPSDSEVQYSIMEDTGGGYGNKPDDDPPSYGQKVGLASGIVERVSNSAWIF